MSFSSQKKLTAIITSVLFIPIIFSTITYISYQEEVNPTEILIVQPNIDPYGEKFSEPMEYQIKTICDLIDSKVTPKTELILAPETALSWSFDEDHLRQYPFYDYLKMRQKKWLKT